MYTSGMEIEEEVRQSLAFVGAIGASHKNGWPLTFTLKDGHVITGPVARIMDVSGSEPNEDGAVAVEMTKLYICVGDEDFRLVDIESIES